MLTIVFCKLDPTPWVIVRDGKELLCRFKFESDALQFVAYKNRDVNYGKKSPAVA